MKGSSSGQKLYKDKTITLELVEFVYQLLPEYFDPAIHGFACPIGLRICGHLDEIIKQFSEKSVFVAIPYDKYYFEGSIIEVLKQAKLEPRLAKDKVETQVILCKICREFRKCKYGVVDISLGRPNVIYEFGLMQSLGRKCAILFLEGSKRPNDLQGIENVQYRDHNDLKMKLGKWLIDNVPDLPIESFKAYLSEVASHAANL